MDLSVWILQLIPQAILLNLIPFEDLIPLLNTLHLDQFLNNFYN